MKTKMDENSFSLVIDTSVYITYALYGKLYRIENAVKQYNLNIYIDSKLLNEFEKNIAAFNKFSATELNEIVAALRSVTISVNVMEVFTQSPDPKDNFLSDLALQTNSEIIVSQEKALLQFANSPVPIHDIKWFKEKFPVPL